MPCTHDTMFLRLGRLFLPSAIVLVIEPTHHSLDHQRLMPDTGPDMFVCVFIGSFIYVENYLLFINHNSEHEDDVQEYLRIMPLFSVGSLTGWKGKHLNANALIVHIPIYVGHVQLYFTIVLAYGCHSIEGDTWRLIVSR